MTLRYKIEFSDVVGFITPAIWLFILEASDRANRNTFEGRRVLLICLGFLVALVFVLNVLLCGTGLRAFVARHSARYFVRFAVNGIQAFSIIVLIILGWILNAPR